MTYYRPQEYAEHYIVPFSDVDGNEWKVSIQEPWYEGSVVTLLGGETPVEWTGRGDESQDEVILGSTGNIRLICTADTAQHFVKGALLPDHINERRVQVFQKINNIWALFWQGFILPETFSQDWDATPYEIELTIVSVVAALEYMPMPLKTEPGYSDFEEETDIAGLLRVIFSWCGAEISNIVTNKRYYEDFNGETQSSAVSPIVHWTQGKVSFSHFYDRENGQIRPKTFKDVVETIAYPYGKVQDYGYDVCFLMRWKHDAVPAEDNYKLFNINIWVDYNNSVPATGNRFGDYTDIPRLSLSALHPESTDNTTSIISAPSSVHFSVEPKTSKTIFELSEKYVDPSLPIGDTLSGKPIEQASFSNPQRSRFLYALNTSYIHKDFVEELTVSNTRDSQLENYPFCKVVDVTADVPGKFSLETSVPLGLCFNVNAINNARTRQTIAFTIPTGIKTRPKATLAKLTLKVYRINEWDPGDWSSESEQLGKNFQINDLSNNRWLTFSNGNWDWVVNESNFLLSNMMNNNGSYELYFNEKRESTDTELHHLRLFFNVFADNALDGNTYGRVFIDVKLEYVQNDFLDGIYFPEQSILSSFAKGISYTRDVRGNSNGEPLDISLETQAGNRNASIDGSVALPFNSFCDATKYMDMQDREKIELEAVKSERYWWGGYYWLAGQYAVIIDGDKVYIPVAIGMNPRMNTIKLILVTTNVTT